MRKLSEKEKIKRSLRYSIMDGSFYSAMVGFGESFVSAFAVFLNATSTQLGILSSLPRTFGSFFQLYSEKLFRFFKSRKKLVYTFGFLQGLMYLPVALVFFLGELKIYYLILFMCLYFIFDSLVSPAWASWMGDLVDEEKRGTYFGRRNKITGAVSFFTMLFAGYLLQHFADNRLQEYMGFAAIFVLAFLSRIVSVSYLMRQYEPAYAHEEKKRLTLKSFFKDAKYQNYTRFVVYLSVMNFAVFVGSPFFTPYMLKELKFDYLTFTIVNGVMILVKLLMMPVWGRFSDKYGARKVLAVSGLLMPLVPIIWVFSTNVFYLLLVQVFSGFAWAGFEIASFNFIFDTTNPKNRATFVAYYNILYGIAMLIGSLVGAYMISHNMLFWSSYIIVFILSGILRYAVSLIFLPTLKEVRKVKPISDGGLLLKVIEKMPGRDLLHFLSFKKR